MCFLEGSVRIPVVLTVQLALWSHSALLSGKRLPLYPTTSYLFGICLNAGTMLPVGGCVGGCPAVCRQWRVVAKRGTQDSCKCASMHLPGPAQLNHGSTLQPVCLPLGPFGRLGSTCFVMLRQTGSEELEFT